MAQVNVVSLTTRQKDLHHYDHCFQFTCLREKITTCGPKPSAKIQDHPGHRWCPLPHYILISCMIRSVSPPHSMTWPDLSLLQLSGHLYIPPSSNRNKVPAAGRHGGRLHPPDGAQPRRRVRLLGQEVGLHGPPPHHRRHRGRGLRVSRGPARETGLNLFLIYFFVFLNKLVVWWLETYIKWIYLELCLIQVSECVPQYPVITIMQIISFNIRIPSD